MLNSRFFALGRAAAAVCCSSATHQRLSLSNSSPLCALCGAVASCAPDAGDCRWQPCSALVSAEGRTWVRVGRLVQKVVYFGSRVQKVVYFPSDNSDLLSSHFSVQSIAIYFTGLSSLSEPPLKALSATHILFSSTAGTAVLQSVHLSVLLPATSLNNESTIFHWLRCLLLFQTDM